MSRPLLSSAALRAMAAQETGEAFLLLLLLEHADLPQPLGFTSDAVDTVSNGTTYLSFPFTIALPNDQEDRPPRVQIVIDNVARELTQAVRLLVGAPTVTLSVVLGSTPSTVEAGPFAFSLKGVTGDALTLTGDLAYEDILDEPYPADSFTPALYPALFGTPA